MKTQILIALTLLAGTAAHCQVATPLAFEVASIKSCPPGTPANPMEHTGALQLVLPGGRFEAKAISLTYLFEWAYDLQPAQHTKLPSPFDSQRYDIVAKADERATETAMKMMLRSLLADRFQLRYHVEQRELPIYAVSKGKSAPKLLPPSKTGEPRTLGMSRTQPQGQKYPTTLVTGSRFTMEGLLDTFARQFDRVMVDRTGIEEEFDFVMEVTPDETRPNAIDESLLLTLMREQLGLQIKAERAQVDFYAIDGVQAPAAD